MHSDRVFSGKANIIIWPSLFFSVLLLMLDFSSFAGNTGNIHKTDSGTYVCRIESDEDSIELTWKRAVEFASSLKYPDKIDNSPSIDQLTREISTSFGFYLYKQMAFLNQVDGIITADLKIILDQDELLAIIGNISFIDYARDRYGKYSPRSSKKYLLADLQEKKKNNEVWQDHFLTIDEKMNLLLAELMHAVTVENALSGR